MSNLKQSLIKLIKRKPFRKWALPDDALVRIENAVNYCVDNQVPLNFVFEFGGYKLWRIPCAPHTDDAELFMLKYYIEYLQPIADLYDFGVNLYFASDDCIVSRMNNIAPEAMEVYAVDFENCLKRLLPITPRNIKISYVRLGHLYSTQNELEQELATHFDVNLKRYFAWSNDKKDKMYKRACLNFCKNGALALEDLSHISDAEYHKRLIYGAVYHDAFEDCSKRKEFVLGKDKILLFCTPIPQAVAIGTTKSSVTKFWTGIGINDNGVEKVLAPSKCQECIHDQGY